MEHLIAERRVGALQPSGTHELSDLAFVAAFEACSLAADAFRHYDHIRLAWVYLDSFGLDEATDRMAESIRRFALYHTGTTAKYNDTLTRAWMRLIAHARAASTSAPDFATFAEANPMLFDRRRAFELDGVTAP